jgi:hypothetical protein
MGARIESRRNPLAPVRGIRHTESLRRSLCVPHKSRAILLSYTSPYNPTTIGGVLSGRFSDTVGTGESGETVCGCNWTGASFPDRLETPLDMASRGLGRNSITLSSVISAISWPKAEEPPYLSVSARSEVLMLLVPPVY